jgi:hypothetical protein
MFASTLKYQGSLNSNAAKVFLQWMSEILGAEGGELIQPIDKNSPIALSKEH